MLENVQLKDKIAQLTEQLVDYQTVLKENEFYKKYLEKHKIEEGILKSVLFAFLHNSW